MFEPLLFKWNASTCRFLLLTALILLLLLLAFVWRSLYIPMLNTAQPVVITVPSGSGIKYLATQLERKKLLLFPYALEYFARLTGEAKKIKFGQYQIMPGMTAIDFFSTGLT